MGTTRAANITCKKSNTVTREVNLSDFDFPFPFDFVFETNIEDFPFD